MYPPLSYDRQLPKLNARQLCPWTMAAELADTATAIDRKQNIFRALNNGLKAIKQFDLPAYRIIFAEENITRKITIWLD
jgi:hypothetical protein